jgi:uncharacterized membrane protein YedE/YeeE
MTTTIRTRAPHSTFTASLPQKTPQPRIRDLVTYLVMGTLFGIIIVKAEVVSWYRIQEMFRFQSFYMYGVLGSAFFTAFVSLQVIKRLKVRSRSGELLDLPRKELGRGYRYWIGGSIFGAGWALCGACPGPLFTLIASVSSVYVVTLLSAIAGAWAYGYLRPRLPH